MALTAQFEGAGRFSAQNRNADGAGLSFGVLQWAQRPGRLHELLAAFQSRAPQQFVAILADGDAGLADRLLAHTAAPNGGVTATGATTDPAFDLVAGPWTDRFQRAGLDRALQQVQVNTALTDFAKSLQHLRTFAPQIVSERGVAFMLDLINQHGDAGAQSIVETVLTKMPVGTEVDLLSAIQAESVARVARQFGNDNVNTGATFN